MVMSGFFANTLVLLRMKWHSLTHPVTVTRDAPDLGFCYDLLKAVSRSFAVVIAQLTCPALRDSICIFYLTLRALDTIEDDMSLSTKVKLEQLRRFSSHLKDPTWRLTDVGEGRERELLEQFPRLVREYRKLSKEFQSVIADICERMADGMCEFLQRPVLTLEDYDLYCHYVAGLVGHGLTQLFACTGLENPCSGDTLINANHMGLFLQKTNIIRDYYEDIVEEPPRMFWPKCIWGQYVGELKDLQRADATALQCLNAMIANAMQHIPHVIEYVVSLKDPSILRFCAIPQLMAIATLSKVYHNTDTFNTKVKISKPESCRIMLDCNSVYDFTCMFSTYCENFLGKLVEDDPSTPRIREILIDVINSLDEYKHQYLPTPYARSIITRYPGLGGHFLLHTLDTVISFLGGPTSSRVGRNIPRMR
ncbi:unnamed protein product [Phytomonas sp. Hart1]|nr:unnamed protein product [Phytomonas sp. Hart1]|eukprot:CCW72013.1 unnamed protein product [Phytomonas sp. isolate Hart1]